MTIAHKRSICVAALALGVISGPATADARPINITWDAVADPAVVGYVVYYGTQSSVYTNSIDAGNALVQAFDLPGAQYYFAVRAYDASGNMSPFSLEVGDAAGVVLTNPGDQIAFAGRPVTLQLLATGSPVAYTATNLPAGLVIDSSTGSIGGTLAANADVASPYLTTAAASDPNGNISSVQFWWSVGAEHAPSVTNPGSQSTVAGMAATLAIVASDADGDPLTYAASGLPSGLAIGPANGIISGTVAATANGIYNVTVTVSDGTLTASAGFSWTISAPAAPTPAAPGGLSVDQLVFADANTSPATTAPFATASAGETLFAFVTGAQPTTAGPQTATVTGAGLTWTLVNRSNAQPGTAEVWIATASTALNNVTVTATLSIPSTPVTLTVISFLGSAGVGASASASASNGAPTVSLTATVAGSFVYGAGVDWDAATPRTLGANQNMVHETVLPSAYDTFWIQSVATRTTASGVPVTLSDLAPTTDRWNFVGVEIVPTLPPSVTASPTSPTAGGSVTASVANGPGGATDWVGLFDVDSNSRITWAYLNGLQTPPANGLSTATLAFATPTTAGRYNARLFAAANSMTPIATSNTVETTAPAAPPPPPSPTPSTGVAVDGVVLADSSTNASSVTTPPFSTTSAGETLIAFVAAAQPTTSGSQTATVKGAGLTWTLVQRANAQPGSTEVWTAAATAQLSNVTVTATTSIGGTQLSLTVVSFTGGAVGASVSGSAATGAPSLSLTTTKGGSLIFGAGNDWDAAIARTLGVNQTMVHETLASTGDSFWVQSVMGSSASAGTAVLVNDLAPTTDRWNMVAIEIVPNGTTPTVSASPANDTTGAPISAAITNGSANATDWVGLFDINAAPGSFLAWAYLNGSQTPPTAGLSSATVAFAAPSTPGQYNVRLFSGGNSTTPVAMSNTVQVTTPGIIAVDQAVSADAVNTSRVTTPVFSTSAPGETLIAFVTAAQPTTTGIQTARVNGAGLTWSLVKRANAQAGSAEVWKATAVDQLSNVTVRATTSIGGTQISLTVVAYRGAGGVGAATAASSGSGAPAVSLTTTKAGSLVYGAGNDWDGAIARTLAQNQAMVHQAVVSSTGDTFWVQNLVGCSTANGVAATVADVAPTDHRWNFVAVEIVPQ